jgi:hypothetical protein
MRQKLRFPRPESRTDFVPVLHGRSHVPHHPGFKVAERTDFQRQLFLCCRTHASNLIEVGRVSQVERFDRIRRVVVAEIRSNSGPFTNIPAAMSPYTNALTAPQQFFRLRGD